MTDTAKPNRKLFDHQMTPGEQARMDYIIAPEPGTTLEEMLSPEYWAHVAKRIRPWDRMEVRAADGSWWAELLVRTVKPFAVKVHVLCHVEFDRVAAAKPEKIDVPEGYEIMWRGRRGFSVKRLSDNVFLKEDLPSKAEAARWLDQYIRDLAA